jgi:hypothetical protein
MGGAPASSDVWPNGVSVDRSRPFGHRIGREGESIRRGSAETQPSSVRIFPMIWNDLLLHLCGPM